MNALSLLRARLPPDCQGGPSPAIPTSSKWLINPVKFTLNIAATCLSPFLPSCSQGRDLASHPCDFSPDLCSLPASSSAPQPPLHPSLLLRPVAASDTTALRPGITPVLQPGWPRPHSPARLLRGPRTCSAPLHLRPLQQPFTQNGNLTCPGLLVTLGLPSAACERLPRYFPPVLRPAQPWAL